MHRCPKCNSELIRRSKRRGFVERVPLTTLFLKPFHCGDCQHRFFRWPSNLQTEKRATDTPNVPNVPKPARLLTSR